MFGSVIGEDEPVSEAAGLDLIVDLSEVSDPGIAHCIYAIPRTPYSIGGWQDPEQAFRHHGSWTL